MEHSEPVKGPSFWQQPSEILLFGGFSVVFGLLLAISALALAPNSSQFENGNLWPLVAWAGVGMIASGFGFMAGKTWGYVLSLIVFSLAYLGSIVQAFERLFVWGIFLEPVVISFLLIPRVRSYFFKLQPHYGLMPEASKIDAIVGSNTEASRASPARSRKITHSLLKPSNVITIILILGIYAIVPAVAISVHTVEVTAVSLNIVYPPGSSGSNFTSIWFGFSPQTVSPSMLTWGGGRMAFSFSLSNLGLFQQHTIDSLAVVTPGFSLEPPLGVPVTLPDLATIRFHIVLQAPDYDFYGPVVLELHTH